MPSMFVESYQARTRRFEERKKKLRAKGILENSSKWNKLLYRR